MEGGGLTPPANAGAEAVNRRALYPAIRVRGEGLARILSRFSLRMTGQFSFQCNSPAVSEIPIRMVNLRLAGQHTVCCATVLLIESTTRFG